MKVCKDVKKEFGNEYHTVTRVGLHNQNKIQLIDISNDCMHIIKKIVSGLDIRNGINLRYQQNLPA